MNELKRQAFKWMLRGLSKERAGCFPQLATFQYDIVGNAIQTNGYYEHLELKFLSETVFPKLRHWRGCLDIGANIGNHSVYFSDYFEHVRSFEPNLRTFKLLEANALLKNNISAENCGLSDTEGTFRVSFDLRNVGMASLERNDNSEMARSAEFSVRRLDDVLRIAPGSGIDFIKIDVEGHELKVLQGAVDTIAKHQPVIVLEVLQSEISDGSSAAIRFLQEHGYPYLYYPQDNRPLANRSRRLAKLVNTLHVLVTARRLDKKLSLQEISVLDGKQNYSMVVCSPYALD